MNRIKNIKAENLKATTFNYDLSAVNVIVGANASGKTAVLSAVRLALLGYEPQFGKTAQATFAACGAAGGGVTHLNVAAAMTDGSTVKRDWTMKKGRVTYDGPDKAYIPTMLLDPTTYFDLTGPARLNYVLSQCDLSQMGLNHDALVAKLEQEIKAESPVEKAAYAGLLQTVRQEEQNRITEDASIYDYLTAVVDKLGEQAKAAKDLADRHEQSVKAMTESKAADGDMSAIQSVQPQLDAARAKLEAAVRAETTALNLFTEAQRAVEEAKALAATLVDETEAQAAIATLRANIEKLKLVPAAGDMPAQVLMAAKPDDTAARNALIQAQNKANQAARVTQAAQEAFSNLIRDIDRAESQTCCPSCGSDITAKQAQVVAGLREQLAKAKQAKIDALSELKSAEDLEDKAASALKVVTTEISCWDVQAAAVDASNRTASKKWHEAASAHNTAQADIQRALAEIARLERGMAGNDKAREAAGKLFQLQAEAGGASMYYTQSKDAVKPIKDEIAKLDIRQRQFIARTQDARRADQSQTEFEAARATAGIYKAALKVVAAEKARASEDAFTALLAKARLFTNGILKAPLQYKDGELGMTWQGNWITHKTFSGTEQLLAFAGLSVALTQNEQCLTRVVLMDELGRLSVDTMTKLTARMLELTKSGVVDQFIGVNPGGGDTRWAAGCNVIVVDAAPAPAAV